MGGDIMPMIRPITDLRNTNEISELCHMKKEPIFITKNGYGDLVVMSIEAYENLMNITQTDQAISRAEKEQKKDGVLLDAKEALSSLRRRHFG
jgi:prevent-host-death family protein